MMRAERRFARSMVVPSRKSLKGRVLNEDEFLDLLQRDCLLDRSRFETYRDFCV